MGWLSLALTQPQQTCISYSKTRSHHYECVLCLSDVVERREKADKQLSNFFFAQCLCCWVSLPFCLGVSSHIWVADVRRAAFCRHTHPSEPILAGATRETKQLRQCSEFCTASSHANGMLIELYLPARLQVPFYGGPGTSNQLGQQILVSVNRFSPCTCVSGRGSDVHLVWWIFIFVVADGMCCFMCPAVWSSETPCHNVTISNICRMLIRDFAKIYQKPSLRHTKVSFYSNLCDFFRILSTLVNQNLILSQCQDRNLNLTCHCFCSKKSPRGFAAPSWFCHLHSSCIFFRCSLIKRAHFQ